MPESVIAVSARSLADAGIDSRLLDCWETTLALGLLASGFRDIRTLLGSQWWFAAPAEPGAAPALDLEPAAARLERLTGLRTAGRPLAGQEPAQACARALAAGRLPLLVTDAHLLPWCPYFGVKHVEHSFAVPSVAADGGSLTAVDAYDNRTEWGTAAPLETTVEADTLAAVRAEQATRIVTLEPGSPAGAPDRQALLRATATALAAWAETDPYAGYAEAHCHPEVTLADFAAFCEACWTIERRRALYAAWLDDVAAEPGSPLPADFAELYRARVARAWAEASKFSYLALRRLRAGRKPAAAIVGLVAVAADAERALAARLRDALSGRAVLVPAQERVPQ